MRPWSRNLPSYLQIISLWPRIAFVYRLNLITDIVFLILQVFLLKAVWTAVYAGQTTHESIDLPTVIAFLTLANLQSWLMSPVIGQFLREWIRDGSVSLHLLRPAPFLNQLISHQVGATLGLAPFVILAFPVAVVVGGMKPPASAAHAVLYVLSLGLAYVLSILSALLLGLVAFWTIEINGIQVIYAFANRFFAGTLIPLWFFPPFLQTIAGLLPFQAQAFIPVAIYLGEIRGANLIRSLLLQVAWIVVLYLLARLVWRQTVRRITIQGG